MTNQQTFEKAINLAIKGGWNAEGLGGVDVWEGLDDYPLEKEQIIRIMMGTSDMPDGYKLVIFNHDFAKALWGEEDTPYDTWSNRKYSAGSGGPDEDWYDGQLWEFHLQQMVVADDPIKYLGDNL